MHVAQKIIGLIDSMEADRYVGRIDAEEYIRDLGKIVEMATKMLVKEALAQFDDDDGEGEDEDE